MKPFIPREWIRMRKQPTMIVNGREVPYSGPVYFLKELAYLVYLSTEMSVSCHTYHLKVRSETDQHAQLLKFNVDLEKFSPLLLQLIGMNNHFSYVEHHIFYLLAEYIPLVLREPIYNREAVTH